MTAVPRWATYRLQLHAGFGFDDAARVVPYLAALGVSHVYTSPCLQAATGSTHGYDVVDHSRVNEELGGADAHRRFVAAVRGAGLGHIVDVVPNHMAITGRQNRWWWDVLEHGPASDYARYFDVDWESPEQRLRNVVLLPVLGDQYGRVLESGEIRLLRDGPSFTIHYHEHVFPVSPGTFEPMFARAGVTPAALQGGDPAAIAALDRVIADINATPDRLDELLERQHYRLAWWQAAQRDLGYRRFFDVNSLIGLCAEDEKVFDDTHRLVLDWVRAVRSMACASIIRTGSATPRDTCDGCGRHAPPATSSWRRSSGRAKRCPRRGRWTARRATTSSTSPWDCSSTRRPRRGSPCSTPSSPASPPTSPPWRARRSCWSCARRSAAM